MTELLTRPLLRRASGDGAGSPAVWFTAVFAATGALVASLALLGVPALVVWFAAGADASMLDAVRVGGQTWLVGHRVALDVETVRLTLAPLGLTVPVVLLLYRAGRWLGRVAAVADVGQVAIAAGVAGAAYGVGGGAVAWLSATNTTGTSPLVAGAVCAALAMACIAAGTALEAQLIGQALRSLPRYVRPALVGGAAAMAVLVAGGAVLVTASIVVHADRVTALARSVDAGVVGGLMVTLIGASLIPNAVGWAIAFALGPGFSVGTGTIVSPAEVHLGAVPALPLLAALPTEVSPTTRIAVLVIPAVAGVAGGWFVHRRGTNAPVWGLALHGAGAGVVAGVAAGIFAMLSGGSTGANRMAQVGPVASQVTLAACAHVGLVAALVAVLLGWRARGFPLPWRPATHPGVDDETDDGADAVTSDAEATEPAMRRTIRVKDARRTRLRRR